MSSTVVIVGALDTKGAEFAYVRDLIRQTGLNTLVVDFGVLGEPGFTAEISRTEVARAGGADLDSLQSGEHKDAAMRAMATGLAVVVKKLYDEGRLQGIIGMGGTGGTSIATAAMRILPVGVPKVMVSTMGGGDVSGYAGTKDITFIPSIVDVAGLNRISRRIYANAAGAISGMVKTEALPAEDEMPLITASLFSNTTACVDHARSLLEEHGYEVLVFHTTGSGGRTMESLVADGYIHAMLDITATELADEVCGGVFSAGPERMLAAARAGIPTVIAPGCVDMCNFWRIDTVPEKYSGRNLYQWSPNVTLMRTNVTENQAIGRMIARAANESLGPVAVLLPLQGVSILGGEGCPFWDPEADQACFAEIHEHVRPEIPILDMNYNINDPEFAAKAAHTLLDLIHRSNK